MKPVFTTFTKTFLMTSALVMLASCGLFRPVEHKGHIATQPTTVQTNNVVTQPVVQEVRIVPRANINKVESFGASSWQGVLQQRLDALVASDMFETTQLGLCVYDLTDDRYLYSVNPDQRMRPASNMKLVTSIAALDLIGTDYSYTPTVVRPGWGWCWDDEETGIRDFQGKGTRKTATMLYQENRVWTMKEVLTPMMKKSDNMLAESMFWQLPERKAKGTRGECSAKVESVIAKTGLNPSDYVIADGSGVSLYNYLSPRLLLMLLRHAYRTPSIYEALYPALPIAGVDGTLSKRMQGTAAQGNVHAKTGTVTGVSCLSGYCNHPSGHLLCFSIMNQGIPKAIVGRSFQDKVCVVLCE